MNCNPNEKPKITKKMRKKKFDYIWKEVNGNPNVYCWLPGKKFMKDITEDEISIQDIPPPTNTIPDDFEEILQNKSELAIKNKQRDLLKMKEQDKNPKLIVSVDDPRKYKVVKDFLIEKKRKIYGGLAINLYLPKEEKIYKDEDVPDYDFFSPDPWNDAVELADLFYKNGYMFSEAKAGVHRGTYKVFVDLWPVADIYYMPSEEYEKIPTKIIRGLNVVSPLKLFESMYKEFSEPYANASRWPKVALREKALRKYQNEGKVRCESDLFSGGENKINDEVAKLIEVSYQFLKSKNIIFTGDFAYNTYMEVGNSKKRLLLKELSILSKTSHNLIQELFTILLKIRTDLKIISSYKRHKELNATTYTITTDVEGQTYNFCNITQLSNCTPYHSLLGIPVVSIDYLKYELYDTSVFGNSDIEINNAKCKLKFLTYVQHRFYKKQKVDEFDDGPFQRFITTCKGIFVDNRKVDVLNRWNYKKSAEEDVIKYQEGDYKVRKIPFRKSGCHDYNKDQCEHPCYWDKNKDKCFSIPRGVYHAEEKYKEEFLEE